MREEIPGLERELPISALALGDVAMALNVPAEYRDGAPARHTQAQAYARRRARGFRGNCTPCVGRCCGMA
jgi:hypothetical protein